jgi:3-isopropylmalate/(R)-2-methylmalate dehydratase small subunit
MKLKGKAWKFGDNVNTDEIIPARYLNTNDPKQLGKHCMEDIDKNFSSKISSGDIILAGANFGCGSSREHAPISIKAAGISCVIAKTFARIFFRNAINIGLPIIECPDVHEKSEAGDTLEINLDTGEISNTTKNIKFQAKSFPDFMREIIQNGGLMNRVKQKIK